MEKTLAVGDDNDDSTDRWGDCVAIIGYGWQRNLMYLQEWATAVAQSFLEDGVLLTRPMGRLARNNTKKMPNRIQAI